jgi:hypothetical protein
MRIGGPKEPDGGIPPVGPTPETGKPGDHKKSLQERREDIDQARDRMTFSSKLSGSEAINLSGISPDDSRDLLQANIFKGWGTGYTGELPGGLMQLQRALQQAESGPVPADAQVFLESAGALMSHSAEEIRQRGDGNHAESLAAFRQQALAVAAKIAQERGPAK